MDSISSERMLQEEARIVRQDPSPLVMKKTRTVKEDGRSLIYYEFEPADPSDLEQ